MIGRIFAIAAGLCVLGQAAWFPAHAEPRIALVIGNSHYGKDIGDLPNPVNDAGLMAQALQETGFQVIKITDADQKKMKRAIADFGDKLVAAGPTATGLFFYAGHGVQVNGTNYLVPIGADISKESDVDIESVAADKVMDQMAFAGSRVNIVVLDACRNNPLQRSFRSATRGLAPMDAARGSFVAYSTAPGSVAADGSGKNSPYTQALAKIIVQPGVGIEEAFRDVRTQVMAATKEKQVPWDSSSLTAPFFFKPASAQFTTASQPAAPAAKPAAATTGAGADNDRAVWDGIKDSKMASDYQAYLDQFPNGIYVNIAKSRLAAFGQGTTRSEQPKAPEPAAAAAAPAASETTSQPVDAAQPDAATTDAAETDAVATDASSPKITTDSRGVDCRIMDATRSESECAAFRKNTAANRGHYGGNKTTGSHGWN